VGRRAYIETFGCQMNVHDSERIAGLLEQSGYDLTDLPGDADLIVVNTCSVREKAEDKLFSRLGVLAVNTQSPPATIAVVGCLAQQEGEKIIKRATNVDVIAGTQAIRRLPLLIQEAENSRSKQVDINPRDDVSFPLGLAVRNDPVKAYITIIEGCNDHCTFCVVPTTRGHERMRPALEIIAEAQQAVSTGHSEIHLLGQIVNHYTAPDMKNCDFARLLELLQEVKGIRRIRFASPHPRHVTDRMLAAIRDLPAVCKHLHLPVQSGSTSVLKAMHRKHSAEQYRTLVDKIRQTIPNIALSTDMIVGFPTETDADFQKTLELTATAQYHSMFSFKYSERPNTLAKSKYQDIIPESVKSERLLELQLTQKRIQVSINQAQIGKIVEVLADSRSRRRKNEISGRTSQNTVVNFSSNNHKIGEILNIEIKEAGPNSLSGEVVSANTGVPLQPITADSSGGNILEQERRSHAG
tara:strand:+ start:5130 stop:6533 length:1404 start_codon:yes stop_codon:yes gene_type:complete